MDKTEAARLIINTERLASFKQVTFKYKKHRKLSLQHIDKNNYKNKFKINKTRLKVKEIMMFMKVGQQKVQ